MTQFLSIALAQPTTSPPDTATGKRWQNPYTTQLPYQVWASTNYGQSFGLSQYSFARIKGGTPLLQNDTWVLGSNIDVGGAYLNIPHESRELWIPFSSDIEMVLRRKTKKSYLKAGHGIHLGLFFGEQFNTIWTSHLDSTDSVSIFHVRRYRYKRLELHTRLDWGLNMLSGIQLFTTFNLTTDIIPQTLALQVGFQAGLSPAHPLHLTCNWSPKPNWQLAVGAMSYIPFAPADIYTYYENDGSFPIESFVSIGYQR